MKLRIHHQELRFRLSPRDLEKLETQNSISDRLELSENVNWTYSLTLEKSGAGSAPNLVTTPLAFEMMLPETEFRTWLAGPEIEWSYVQAEPKLDILIEKDLKPHRT